jgi:hypothetical protein
MAPAANTDVLRLHDIPLGQARQLLGLFGLQLRLVPDGQAIPGSYWGECEAGLIGTTVFVRMDTPVHSLLHESCHLIVQPPERRAAVHTDASDSIAEEDAACYLQLLLADRIDGFGFERACRDMDAWGYSFRLGSAKAWFEQDAEDAAAFLRERQIRPLTGMPALLSTCQA